MTEKDDHTSRYSILGRREDMINMCFRCGLCRTVCPSFEETGLESASPRGRVQFAKAVLDGKAELDRAVGARMLDCLNCMRCADVCPSGVRTNEIVLDARAELVKRGKLNPVKKLAFNTVLRSPPLLAFGARAASLGKKWFYDGSELLKTLVPKFAGMDGKHFPSPSTVRSTDRWPEVVPPTSGKPVMRAGYFIGCATNLIFTGAADATIRVLGHNGVEVVIPRGQSCCGIPVYTSGDTKNARKLAESNLRLFDGLEIDCIVTDCGSCSAALKHEIGDLMGVGPFSVPVYDINEFLVNIIEIRRDFRELPVRATYHDPCHLRRGQDIHREPRELLRMIPGLEFVEMEDADRCCGGAGTFSYTHHELSRKVGARKARAIRETGADYVVTPCPSCTMQIDDLLHAEGLDRAIVHPVELLDVAYGNVNEKITVPGTSAAVGRTG